MNNRYIKTTLIFWACLSVLSFSLFSYFAYNPQAILVVETYQPGASYERAKLSAEEGDLDEALSAYRRGIKYFKQLYEESGLERHKLFVGQGLLGIAHIYKNVMEPPLLVKADEHYVEAINWLPGRNQAYPYYFLAHTRIEAEHYSQAIGPLTSVIKQGNYPISIESLYYRGMAYFNINEYDLAAEDWYNYLRFSHADISTERWNHFSELSSKKVETPYAIYIHALERYARQEPEESIQLFSDLHDENSFEVPVRYYIAALNNDPIDSGFGARSFQTIYPSSFSSNSVRMCERSIDIYAANNKSGKIEIEISLKGTKLSSQLVQFNLNGNDFYEIVCKNPEQQHFSVNCSFLAGKNVLRIREVDSNYLDDENGVYLHSISIDT